MNPGDYVRLYFENGPIGCGWRYVVVIELGRKWATVGDAVLGTIGRIPRGWLAGAEPHALPQRRLRRMGRRLGRMLRRTGAKPTSAQRRLVEILNGEPRA